MITINKSKKKSKVMTSALAHLKQVNHIEIKEPISSNMVFKLDCLERIGKQMISILVSSGLIRSEENPTNRDISLALKTLEPLLINKLKLKDKRQLYRVFGLYCYQQLPLIKDQTLVELQLMQTFFKIMDASKVSTSETSTNDPQNSNSFTISSQESKKNEKSEDFDKTSFQGDVQEENPKIYQKYFIGIVAYLEKLSSPQGELTYIWQHLKYQGFQTQYEPFMNEANQWTCTATIRFPPGMYKDSFLSRTQYSKNKKKARQLACMDLLKSLYLSYPEVWMLYKHLKQEKRLVISSLDGPKDQDEIQLIRSRKGIVMDNDKIEKLFRHNKKDIRKLMEKISAKAQLNTLLQQLPGRVTSPKLEKKIVEGNWSVPVKIEYKTYEDIQNNRLPKIYEKTIVFYNTKIAEEQAYMEAIIEMYQDNPELFQKIQSIKLAKNIKDPEKKLPLLRNAKEVK